MLVKLPGAVLGPESNGGIDKLRETRQGNSLNAIDESPAFALNSAPNGLGGMGGMGINGMTADQLIAQMMMGALQGVEMDMESLAQMVEEEMAYEPGEGDEQDGDGEAEFTEAEIVEDDAQDGGRDGGKDNA